ncbi:MAG TPA: CrcB family protein [Propionibacteriaceae bacterium]|nr:CrcB family protein [Propionibacteriaceae bacterium]
MAVTPTRTSSVPPGLWVFIGGCAGALTRALISTAVPDSTTGVPTTTLAINLSGALVLGWLLRTLALTGGDRGWHRALRLGVGTGVLGGYTTFSTFAIQTVELARNDHLLAFVAYLGLSLVGGFAAAWAGTAIARSTTRRHR